MSDLQTRLEGMLRAIEDLTPHSVACRKPRSNYGGAYPTVFRCNCDITVRVQAAIARAVERMIKDAELRGAMNLYATLPLDTGRTAALQNVHL